MRSLVLMDDFERHKRAASPQPIQSFLILILKSQLQQLQTENRSNSTPRPTSLKMSYSIKVRVFQTNPNAFFHIVEKGCWHYGNGCQWSEQNGVLTLNMGQSGTSGMLRFKTEENKEAFFVVLGVHNYKPWVDIVTGLGEDITCVKALPEYYGDASDRTKAREAQRAEHKIQNIDRRIINTKYKVKEGNNLELDIIIG
ncbi:fruit body lectin [Fusarium sporotrichioides]|jgi:hypothetical protein|uniref:Fruit body lectin n=1 Tax=Fusarium sporotrichioides TaxID=5514 RepID=A0A395SN42_FUSSP|nr:fruit body lectin [Fusarium sporotrichioides]